tara:strand:- start:268 stop:864 length:597 start_codon:yes stop_codon:yes gene_type:complete
MTDGQQEFDLAELARRLTNIVRPGTIDSADYGAALVRVRFDANWVSGWLPWLTRRAGADVDWWAPEVGEQVIVLSPMGDPAQGWVLPAGYSNAVPAPAASPDMAVALFQDGFKVSHDRANNHTVLDAWDSEGTIELRAKNIILKTGEQGFFHLDHYGKATRITHTGGVNFVTDTWDLGSNTVGNPDQGFNPPEVEIEI